MRTPITEKKQMYELLQAGMLGNRVPIWFDLQQWRQDTDDGKGELWALRSMRKSDKAKLRLGLAPSEVIPTANQLFPAGGFNVSPVYNEFMTARIDVALTEADPAGLYVYWTQDKTLRNGWQHSHGVTARMLLRQHLWPSDLDCLDELLELYPDHVVELSAFERAVGVVPCRNTVTWEVRRY